jgi:putative spermidine/putrescine transport system ATP-binding protein
MIKVRGSQPRSVTGKLSAFAGHGHARQIGDTDRLHAAAAIDFSPWRADHLYSTGSAFPQGLPPRMDQSAVIATSSGAQVRLRQLSKAFGAAAAVDDVSLDVPAGAFVSLLGPSGSGKTTTLNLIAGFLAPDKGDILIDDRSVADVPPHKRNIGMVFQSYSLFPHMTVADNVAFPLRMRAKLSREETRKRIAEMLTLVQLGHLASRYPRQLSGGQQQRVAMARALVSRPRLLLMDEPLGALDKKLREQMQAEIKHIHRSVGTTVVYVTHDQSEALTMSDLVVVMHRARIAQIGTPRALYESPSSAFVADFLGDSNLIPATIIESGSNGLAVKIGNGVVIHGVSARFSASTGERVFVLIRPEDMAVRSAGAATRSNDTLDQLEGAVIEHSFHGDVFKLNIAVGNDILKVKVPREQGVDFGVGRNVSLSWAPGAARLLPNAADDIPAMSAAS